MRGRSGSSWMVWVVTLGSLGCRHSSCTRVRAALSALTGTLSGFGGLTYSLSEPSSRLGNVPAQHRRFLSVGVLIAMCRQLNRLRAVLRML